MCTYVDRNKNDKRGEWPSQHKRELSMRNIETKQHLEMRGRTEEWKETKPVGKAIGYEKCNGFFLREPFPAMLQLGAQPHVLLSSPNPSHILHFCVQVTVERRWVLGFALLCARPHNGVDALQAGGSPSLPLWGLKLNAFHVPIKYLPKHISYITALSL